MVAKESKIEDLLFVVRTNMKRIRNKKGVTLQELGNRLDKDPSYLSRMESGKKKLNFDIIDEYAIHLSVDPFQFFLPTEMSSSERDLKNRENKTNNVAIFGNVPDGIEINEETFRKWAEENKHKK